MKRLTHFSLFSGIGGIDIAAEWAGFETVGQCEFADYPTKVLEKHWPNVPRWRDIRDVTSKTVRNAGIKAISLLSGGFPCQPHSVAGKRLASDDDRDLWGEFARVICELRPRWVLAENVSGLLSSENGRFLGRVLGDLAQMGYDARWLCFPASWVGAIHRRERIFIIAYSSSFRWSSLDESIEDRFADLNLQARSKWSCAEDDPLPYVSGILDPPISGILRNDDGLSEGMDRLKCLGNAVVPQQVYPILQAIAEIEIAKRL